MLISWNQSSIITALATNATFNAIENRLWYKSIKNQKKYIPTFSYDKVKHFCDDKRK